MGCCRPSSRSTTSPPKPSMPTVATRKEETIQKFPGATVHLLLEPDQYVKLGEGDLSVLRVTDEEIVLATVIKVGNDVRWPLTKDEPVVKVDELSYIFSLPDKDGGFLNYGVSFSGVPGVVHDRCFDAFLKENSCFSIAASDGNCSTPKKTPSSFGGTNWAKYTPRIGDYNKLLREAIAGGTGQVVKGIFACSDVYSNQIQKGAKLIQPKDAINRDGATKNKVIGNNGVLNKSIRRVRQLSGMTEKMSKSLLDGVVVVTDVVIAPVAKSKTGKAILGSFPVNVVVASLDVVNKLLDTIEAAERRTIATTGGALAEVASKRFGENAGQATEDAFATTGHIVGTAWNIFKIRKALKPPSSSSLPSSILKNAIGK